MWKKLEKVDSNCFWESGAKFEPMMTFNETKEAQLRIQVVEDACGFVLGIPTGMDFYRSLFIPHALILELYKLSPSDNTCKGIDLKDEKINILNEKIDRLEEEIVRLTQRCNDWKKDYQRDAMGDTIKDRIENNKLREENEKLKKEILRSEDEGRLNATKHIMQLCQNMIQGVYSNIYICEKSEIPEGYKKCVQCNRTGVASDGSICFCARYGKYAGFVRDQQINKLNHFDPDAFD